MQPLINIQQRTEQVKELTSAIHKWNSMCDEFAELKTQIDELHLKKEGLRLKMADHHTLLDDLQKALRPSGPEILWHEILYGPKP